ncbi:Lrp/AsnC family transcriptional regulator [Candidatus Micrarchaeota archaeon]|nr:Lrp/AsnC family transcriptional regulator [Candidatus Micrarchaeota archaeon]
MDDVDLRIIHTLLKDSRTSLHRIGQSLGISPTAVRKRIERLKKEGIIRGQTILINEQKIGWEKAIVGIKTSENSFFDVINRLRSVRYVKEIYTSTGPYSIVVEVRGPIGITKHVFSVIKKIGGIEGICPLMFVERMK